MLMGGTLPKSAFTIALAQMLGLHQALEQSLTDCKTVHPALGAMYDDTRSKVALLRADLETHGLDPDHAPILPITQAYIERIERLAQQEPIGLLGPLYVLEGSNNGNRFIAKGIRRAYQLEGDAGTRYFDPYGESQPANWRAFKAAINEAVNDGAEQNIVIREAQACFDAITTIHEGVIKAHEDRA